jgi:hypothetical protein
MVLFRVARSIGMGEDFGKTATSFLSTATLEVDALGQHKSHAPIGATCELESTRREDDDITLTPEQSRSESSQKHELTGGSTTVAPQSVSAVRLTVLESITPLTPSHEHGTAATEQAPRPVPTAFREASLSPDQEMHDHHVTNAQEHQDDSATEKVEKDTRRVQDSSPPPGCWLAAYGARSKLQAEMRPSTDMRAGDTAAAGRKCSTAAGQKRAKQPQRPTEMRAGDATAAGQRGGEASRACSLSLSPAPPGRVLVCVSHSYFDV